MNATEVDGNTELLETMAKMGEIELTPDEPEQTVEETPVVGQPRAVVLNGKEYSEEQLMDLISKGQSSQNDEKWQARNTQRSMELAEEKRQLETERANLKAEYDKMRGGYEGDPGMQKFIDLLELQHQRNQALEREVMSQKREVQSQKDLQFIQGQKIQAEQELGEKLPEIGTPEFNQIIELAANGNRLKMAYLASKGRSSPSKPLPNLKNTAVEPTTPSISNDMQRAIDASGLDPEFIKSLM